MKKLIFLILILFSCEKEPDPVFCWSCKHDVFKPGATYSVIVLYCDKTEAEIKQMEKENNTISGTTTTTLVCKKQK